MLWSIPAINAGCNHFGEFWELPAHYGRNGDMFSHFGTKRAAARRPTGLTAIGHHRRMRPAGTPKARWFRFISQPSLARRSRASLVASQFRHESGTDWMRRETDGHATWWRVSGQKGGPAIAQRNCALQDLHGI